MKENNKQDILDNDLGSREEVEIHDKRVEELEQYHQGGKKKLKNRIIVFSTLLITALVISIYAVKCINEKDKQ